MGEISEDYHDSMDCEEAICDCCGEYASECQCGEGDY